ncbi:MAG: hypothetical protein C0P72_006700 [Clostridia bacterium]|nr:MAG: hypothetical protein DIU80_24125 [Chloroflexota bacterium]
MTARRKINQHQFTKLVARREAKMLPCHKKLAELYAKFSDGMNLRVELMGPQDWQALCESLKANQHYIEKIIWLEMQADAAELMGDRNKALEFKAKRAYQILNLNKC